MELTKLAFLLAVATVVLWATIIGGVVMILNRIEEAENHIKELLRDH